MNPNIVLVLTDDHSPWSLPCYGNAGLTTPWFDRLAARSAVFENAFSPSPVCSPARACLMTGLTPSQTGIHDWLDEREPSVGNKDWLQKFSTLPLLLKQVGYQNILSGKWHLGRSHLVPDGFDRAFSLPYHQGTHFGTYTYHQDGSAVSIGGDKSIAITDRAIAMLDERGPDPFFLNIGYIATHSPYKSAAHDPAIVKLLKRLPSVPFTEYRPHPWANNEGCDTGGKITPEEILDLYRGYYAGVLEIDRCLGLLFTYLETNRLLDNTVFIYTSDHGCSLGHHGFFGKGNSTRPLNMYDTSLRVPLLISGPEAPNPRRISLPVDHYDLFQALCEWGGVSLPSRQIAKYPGESLASIAKGNKPVHWRETRYAEYGDSRMIRTERYKFVRRYPRGPDELFDLAVDPNESQPIVDPERAANLCAQLESWYADFEDPVRRGTRVKCLPKHNPSSEAWRDGKREARGLQFYPDGTSAV